MGIIDEALRALGESEERIKQVTAAASARQVKYLEDNAGKDTDGHWLFWNDENNIFKFSFDKFKELLKTEPINGQKLASIISKLNPLMKRLKNMPAAVKGGAGTLTFDQFKDIYDKDSDLRALGGDFSKIFMTVDDFNSENDPADYLFATLTGILRLLQTRLAEITELDEGQISFRSQGVENEVELALSTDAPIIHSMVKNWFGPKFKVDSENATPDTVVQLTVDHMTTALENDIRMKKSNLDGMLDFVARKDLLNLDKETLERYSHCKTIPECSDALIENMGKTIMEETNKKLKPTIDRIHTNFSLTAIGSRTGIGVDSPLANLLATDILTTLKFELLDRDLNNFDNLSGDFPIFTDIVGKLDNAIPALSKQVDDIISELDSLRSNIDNLPTELKDKITELMNNDLFGAASGKALTDFPKTVEETISGYYEC